MIIRKKRFEELEERVNDLENCFAKFLVDRTMERLAKAMEEEDVKKVKKVKKVQKVKKAKKDKEEAKQEVKQEPKKRGRKPKKEVK